MWIGIESAGHKNKIATVGVCSAMGLCVVGYNSSPSVCHHYLT